MQVRKSSFLKRCLSVLLMGTMAVGAMGVMAGTARAATTLTCVPAIGPPPTQCITATSGASGTVTAGGLSETVDTPIINGGITPTATTQDQNIPYEIVTHVVNATSPADGWTLGAEATAITLSSGTTEDIVLNSEAPVHVACAPYSTCTAPTPDALAASKDLLTDAATTPVHLISTTAAATSLGAFDVTLYAHFKLTPADVGSLGEGIVTFTLTSVPA